MHERPLSALQPGDRGTIGRLDGGGPIRQRLLELGLTPGTTVTLVRLAPLRDPMEIRVRGYQLCVRRSEADAVWVHVEATAAMPHVGAETRGPATGRTGGAGVASALSTRSAAPSPSACFRLASFALSPFRAFRHR